MPFEFYFSKGEKKMNISLKFYIQSKNKDSNFIPFLTSIEAIMRHYIHSYLEKHTPGIPENKGTDHTALCDLKCKLNILPNIIRGEVRPLSPYIGLSSE